MTLLILSSGVYLNVEDISYMRSTEAGGTHIELRSGKSLTDVRPLQAVLVALNEAFDGPVLLGE